MSGHGPPSTQVRILKRVKIYKSPWLRLERIFYQEPSLTEDIPLDSCEHFKTFMCDDEGSPLNLATGIRYWDVFARNSKETVSKANSATTVPICYKLVNDEYNFYISVVEQFRPYLNMYTLEFPSGICETTESVKECAVRELKEETGYTGVAITNSPNLPTSVFANENTCLVTVLVDLDSDVNMNPVQNLDPTETITPHLFPLNRLLQNLEEHSTNTGSNIADNLYFFCYSLSLLPYEALAPHMENLVKSFKH